MQFVGEREIVRQAADLASRASRREVSDWIRRVVPRQIRKTEALLSRMEQSDHRRLRDLIEGDRIPADAAKRIIASFKGGEPVFCPNREAVAAFMRKVADVMDWIESLDDQDRRIRRIERMSWQEAEALSASWHASVVKKAHGVRGDLSSGVRRIADLEGGAYVVELETKGALTIEGRAMKHCVSSYWPKVSKGKSRILSVRGENGIPAVTIELNPLTMIDIQGYGKLRVTFRPRNGDDLAYPESGEWWATQVRGPSNTAPKGKWLELVMAYLRASGIKWTEPGDSDQANADRADAIQVFTISGKSFIDRLDAVAFGEMHAIALMKSGKSFRAAYEETGLRAIHQSTSADRSREYRFMTEIMSHCLQQLGNSTGKRRSLLANIRESGVAYVMSNLGRDGESGELKRTALSNICDLEGLATPSNDERTLMTTSPGTAINLIVHRVPLLLLSLLGNGLLKGVEDGAIDRIKPLLESVMSSMESRKDAIHAVMASESGSVSADGIFKAFLVCGMAQRLERVTAEVADGLRFTRSNMIFELKRMRRTGAVGQFEFRRQMQILSDGFEDRLEAMVREITLDKPFIVLKKRANPVTAKVQAPARPATGYLAR